MHVMAGLVLANHVLLSRPKQGKSWMPGSPVYAKASPDLRYWSAEALAKAEARA